jgi:hypothetical protein
MEVQVQLQLSIIQNWGKSLQIKEFNVAFTEQV